ncbi:MAG: hypothetical protein EKK48_19460 [Candidatus Melainabacteria bacterium]|nr:MAG: hypothetical protein EKK48_19460 [Candidatus Melainabacteria bacterium]
MDDNSGIEPGIAVDEFCSDSIDQTSLLAAPKGLISRCAYLALIGELETDSRSVIKRLGSTGEHGKQLQTELDRLRVPVEKVTIFNRAASGYSQEGFFGRSGTLGTNGLGKITYRRNLFDSFFDAVTHTGNVGPRTSSAFTLAHEIGHFDGIHGYQLFSKGADPKLVAKSSILKETSAIVSALKWQQEVGKTIQDSSIQFEQLRAGKLGSYIKQTWTYPELKSLTNSEADAISASYIKKAFPGLLKTDGSLGNYSLNDLQKFNRGSKIPSLESVVSENLGNSARRTFGSPLKKLALFGALATINEIEHGFKQSPKEGINALIDTGVAWLGWESGVKLLLRNTATTNPFLCIAAGIAGSVCADMTLKRISHRSNY